jgi:hypothetical protein
MSTIGLCGRQGLLLATASTIALALWVAAKHPEPLPAAPPRISTAAATLEDPGHPMTIIGTISEIDRTFHCGMFLWVTQIRYGDRFGVLVPCIESGRRRGLRFKVGDEHRLFVDEHGCVRAIEWNGRVYPFADRSFTVLTPAAVIGHVITVTTEPDSQFHYRADGWHWN